MLTRRFATIGVLFGLACAHPKDDSGGLFGTTGDAPADGGSTATGGGGDDQVDGGSADTPGDDGGSSGDGDSSDDGPGVILDVGNSDPLGCHPEDEDCGCNAVDLLFIVDNSGSMNYLVPAFNQAFPIFVDEMFSVLPPQTDLHVGIARASGYYDPGNSSSADDPVTCIDPQQEDGNPNVGTWNPPTVADTGINGQQGRLFEWQGQRYFEIKTDEDPAPLAAWFGAALLKSIEEWTLPHSNTETIVAGSGYPFHAVNAAHNAGFMRQNAVLILYLISNHSDMTPADIPTQDFIDMVRDAKAPCGGDLCILTGGALPLEDCYGQPGNINTRLYDFLNGFGKEPASLVDISVSTYPNAPDFTGVLGEALAEVVAATCEQIRPEG